MPVSPELLSALSAYERIWRSDVSDDDVDAAFARGFTDHRPGADGAAVEAFREHWLQVDLLGLLTQLKS